MRDADVDEVARLLARMCEQHDLVGALRPIQTEGSFLLGPSTMISSVLPRSFSLMARLISFCTAISAFRRSFLTDSSTWFSIVAAGVPDRFE